VFRSLVERRLGKEGLRLLFGKRPVREKLVDDVIGVCGGHFRDLLRLLRDTVVRATPLPTLPVPPAVIAHTINAARRDFLPIAQDDARWLAEIARGARHGITQHRGDPGEQVGQIPRQPFCPLFYQR